MLRVIKNRHENKTIILSISKSPSRFFGGNVRQKMTVFMSCKSNRDQNREHYIIGTGTLYKDVRNK